MNSNPLPSYALARTLLLAGQRADVGSTGNDADLVARGCERLRVPLTNLAGSAGFSSLLSRALSLAKRRAPVLQGMRVETDGSLAGFAGVPHDAPGPDVAHEAGVVLLAELLGLLVTLIGEPLTLGLLRDAWPEAPVDAISLRTEERP